jgi:hypothetical protein
VMKVVCRVAPIQCLLYFFLDSFQQSSGQDFF